MMKMNGEEKPKIDKWQKIGNFVRKEPMLLVGNDPLVCADWFKRLQKQRNYAYSILGVPQLISRYVQGAKQCSARAIDQHLSFITPLPNQRYQTMNGVR
jgi:hypothetical protein